jgi:hypothetical protein
MALPLAEHRQLAAYILVMQLCRLTVPDIQ